MKIHEIDQSIIALLKMPPWANGPFELIKHANEHFVEKSDIDRRMALIGFDNAIEVSINSFISLPSKLRGGIEIQRSEIERATSNYHTKIEFLDRYIKLKRIDLFLPVKDIIWYHQLRNELYHSGNGMVPEKFVLEGIRAASILVFKALYDIDVSILYDNRSPQELIKTVIEAPKQASEILETIEKNGLILSRRRPNSTSYARVCILPVGRFGISIDDWDEREGKFHNITAFSKKYTDENLFKYLDNCGYKEDHDPLSR